MIAVTQFYISIRLLSFKKNHAVKTMKYKLIVYRAEINLLLTYWKNPPQHLKSLVTLFLKWIHFGIHVFVLCV